MVNHEVTVELKNDISIRGTLKSVDQYLNIKLDDISILDELKYPHLVRVKSKHDHFYHHTSLNDHDARGEQQPAKQVDNARIVEEDIEQSIADRMYDRARSRMCSFVAAQ